MKPSGAIVDTPPVLIDELHGAHDRLADGQLWAPAEAADACAVEKDERAVSDPATLAARVPALRGELQRFGDPTDRIVDFASFVGAQVIDTDLVALFECN